MSHLRGALSTKVTPQSEPIPGSSQVENSAGGYSYGLDIFGRLRRFLILGTEGGSYYATEQRLTKDNATSVLNCLKQDGHKTVDVIVEVSEGGLAAKNDYAIWALALCAGVGDVETKRYALSKLALVCRTGTHLLQFADFVYQHRGWGRSLRRAVGEWYAREDLGRLTLQAVKYRDRAGYRHADLLRLAHPASVVSARNPTVEGITDEHRALYDWIVRGGDDPEVMDRFSKILHGVEDRSAPEAVAKFSSDDAPSAPADHPLRLIEGFERARTAPTPADSAQLVREYRLPREALQTDHLKDPMVWEALLEDMPMTAMIRNLATMTRNGLLAPLSNAEKVIVDQLGDIERLRRARVHPLNVLSAMLTYASGRSVRGSGEWAPVVSVVDALDAAFYAAFQTVEPSGKRHLLALDVSGSMGGGLPPRGSIAGAPQYAAYRNSWFPGVGGVPGLSPRAASSAMALVTAAAESGRYECVAFTGGGRGGYGRHDQNVDALTPLPLSPRERIDDVCARTDGLPFGGTDCALPMLYAMAQGREVDVFVVYTDNETWAGDIHPTQALQAYRQQSGIAAKLIVVGMVANEFTIADPNDAGMLDVVGFDASAPRVMSEFAKGNL